MSIIKYKKPSKRVCVNHLVRNDKVKVRTINGSELLCMVMYVGLNGEDVYTCQVLNKRKAAKDKIYPGDLVDLTIDDVYEVTRIGRENDFKTLKKLREMLDSEASNEEILKAAVSNFESDVFVFFERYFQLERINGSEPFFHTVWDEFNFKTLRDINSKFVADYNE